MHMTWLNKTKCLQPFWECCAALLNPLAKVWTEEADCVLQGWVDCTRWDIYHLMQSLGEKPHVWQQLPGKHSAHRIHMSTTQPKSHQKLQDVTHNYVPTPFCFCNPRNASERQRGSTGADWKLDSCYKQRQYRTAKWTEQSICSFWNILKFTSATLSRPLSRPLSRVHRPEAVKTFLNVTSGNLQCMASTFTHTHIQPASSTGQSPHVLQDSNRVTGSMMAVCCKISQCRSKCGQSVLAIMDCHVLNTCWSFHSEG